MSSIIQYSLLLLGGLLVLVSSFSTRLPSCGFNQNKYRNDCSPLSLGVSHPYKQKRGFPLILSMSSQVATTEDSQEVRGIFSKYCDKDSLIDRKTLESMPPFADMMAEEDLLPEELDEIWEAAPKSSDDASRVDVVSFAQIYREVDDMFEDDDGSDSSDEVVSTAEATPTAADIDDNELDEELTKAYRSICDDKGLISKDKMKQWEEIESLFEEGLLGEDEFEELWENAVNKENGSLDASGFSTFNSGLDDLFVVDDDEDEDEDINTDNDESEELSTTSPPPRAMVTEDDMPPGVLFSLLADKNHLVGMEELNLWTELKEFLEDGDLSESELREMYDKFATPESSGKLTEEGFLQLYDEIDSLFEEVDDEDDAEEVAAPAPAPVVPQQQQQQSQLSSQRVKEDLLGFIDIIVEEDENEEPCGFGATESDQGQIMNIVQVLEQQPTNMIVQKEGNIELIDLVGMWEMIYTSSSAMKFNQGLSGIGGSFPNGKFGGVRQELRATKWVSDMEYKERIEVNPSISSFDVTVNGDWDLQKSMSLFTGSKTVILNVVPDKVKYGLTSTRADHWKSLGPTNRLDLSYLDDDLRVMRGCTSSDTIFVFKRIKE